MPEFTPTPLVPIFLFGWLPMCIVLFAVMPKRTAAAVCFLIATMFLPVAKYDIRFLPEYSRVSATSLGVLAAILILDTDRIFRFRPNWLDLPVLALCLSPMLSSLRNGYGAYDGVSAIFTESVFWLIPYFVGRLYFSEVAGLRQLLLAIFISGLIYMPLCWFEMRFSPQLHRLLYGYHAHSFVQTLRWGGFRPTVFMRHGLCVSLWMAIATLSGFWMWQAGGLRRMAGVPVGWLVGLMALTTVLCRSTGSVLQLLFFGSVLLLMKKARTSLPVVAVSAGIVFYLAIRATGMWDGMAMVDAADAVFGPARAGSLETRIVNENMLAARARQRFVFGWGGWGEARVKDEEGRDITITDSLWIIRFGNNGIIGMAALVATILLPALVQRLKVPPGLWTHPAVSGSVVAAVILCLWMSDLLLNADANPVLIMLCAGLAGMKFFGVRAARQPETAPAQASTPRASRPPGPQPQVPRAPKQADDEDGNVSRTRRYRDLAKRRKPGHPAWDKDSDTNEKPPEV